MNPRQLMLVDYLETEILEAEDRVDHLKDLRDAVAELDWDEDVDALAMSQLSFVFGKPN